MSDKYSTSIRTPSAAEDRVAQWPKWMNEVATAPLRHAAKQDEGRAHGVEGPDPRRASS